MKYSIKELRARKNNTQEEVAKAIGVTPQTYCAWEKDLHNVGISKVHALAEYFGVKIDDIKYA
jgi:DNA-binding XRE family transcriptional regulator